MVIFLNFYYGQNVCCTFTPGLNYDDYYNYDDYDDYYNYDDYDDYYNYDDYDDYYNYDDYDDYYNDGFFLRSNTLLSSSLYPAMLCRT